MALKVTRETCTAIAYLAPAAAVAAIWWILLTVGNSPKNGPGEILQHVLFEAPERSFFWWLIALPATCMLLSLGYFSSIARGKIGAVLLSTMGLALAVAAWLLTDWTIAFFVTLPLMFSIPNVKRHLTNSRSGP